MPECIVTREQMAKIDQHAIETIGIPSMVLMERAAYSVAEEILSFSSDQENIAVFAGVGNNGGDGVAVARMLYLKNRRVTVLLLGKEQKASEETKKQLNIARNIGMKIETFAENVEYSRYTIIVDALFGIGINRPVEGEAASIIDKMNQSQAKVVAVDISSGLSADTGKPFGKAVKADLTVTFGWKKRGMTLAEGELYSGWVIVKDIGYPRQSFEFGMRKE